MIDEIAREAVARLTSTEEFHQLRKAMLKLKTNPQSQQCVDQFTQDHAEALQKPDGGGRFIQENLERRFSKMMQIPEIANYINAGQEFDNLVTQLHQSIDVFIDKELEGKN